MKFQAIFPSLKNSCFILVLSLSMLIFTLPALTFAQSNNNVTSGTDYYVSPAGSDLNPGTLNQPFATIQKAANVAKEGSTIYIRGGVYNQKVRVTHSGASGAPITFQNYQNEKVILDGSKVKLEDDGLFTIEDKNYIQVNGLEFRNLKSTKISETPIGIYITGTGSNIEIRNNYIHHIEANVKNGNAHGIAVYGTSSNAQNNLNHIVIDNNEVANLKLGLSEAIAVNGNVDSFEVTDNKVHDNNNIGIVLIGHEGVSPVAALDQARNGIVRNNIVHHNSSFNNTSYNEYSADGIYVDGGKEIIIEQNQSYENDLGIEVASEHAGKSASQITVRDNTISNNIMSGIALGGYDSQQGYAENNTITNNIIYKNDTRDQESGQIELNYDTRNNVITNNHIYASNSPIFISNNFNKNTANKLDYNHYYGEFDQNNGLWQWKRKTYKGFSTFQASMNQEGNEQHSVFSKLSPSFKLISK
ncbi:right-handed parallel beta-helix repeat-containing protein [Bacillus thuringiensis]|uniref:right-handed parallel beta-helix repeat-containing protein n=1 Tax=Bacillus thuringiensis TaxID=1428 RepID=UPI000BF677E5|nr:right-handed parallel beta-helix repeat-containing protein [Bacillus thuringiensis]MDA2251879.1 right-handed parallel beta-helix repeat-containing protein [Bacillus cereus]MDA2279828.1 right-handed parallel beta-helix repeat-containing protein [Bacillus cereus]MDA2285442.1 right-handed parallel beta-helix repeat-containing protein [Bacillus cereus]MDA2296370.1 right-handed parallel beta-helix repeat-containing protein [Bacillus cereus]MED3269579.1 right-handed parallel beta-helix repeat-con